MHTPETHPEQWIRFDKWTHDELNDKRVEFRLVGEEGGQRYENYGIGFFVVYESHPKGLKRIIIRSVRDGYYEDLILLPKAAETIEIHPNQAVASFRAVQRDI